MITITRTVTAERDVRGATDFTVRCNEDRIGPWKCESDLIMNQHLKNGGVRHVWKIKVCANCFFTSLQELNSKHCPRNDLIDEVIVTLILHVFCHRFLPILRICKCSPDIILQF